MNENFDNNVLCPICGYNLQQFPKDRTCPNCETDLKGQVFKTYDGKIIAKTFIQLHEKKTA
jgi:rubrerythrin